MKPFLSPEGLFSLRPTDDWRYERTSEDGSIIFHRPAGRSLVRFVDSLQTDDAATLLPEGRPCRINGMEARCMDEDREDSGGRVRHVRHWVVSNGRTVVHVTGEWPADVRDEVDDASLQALVETLTLHTDPHPVVADLLGILRRDKVTGQSWSWHPHQPLMLLCRETQQWISVETLVRSADFRDGRRAALIESEARRIRNLACGSSGGHGFEQVADGLLPVIRTGVLRESVDARMRALGRGPAHEELVCGDALLRRLFAPGLFVYYGLDVPGAFHFVTPAQARGWGLTAAQIESRSLQNLQRKMLQDVVDTVAVGEFQFFLMEDGEGFAASRLLFPSFRARLRKRLGVPYRVALPSAGVLIAFSSGLDNWKEYLGEDVWDAYLREPVPLTEQIFESAGDDVFVPIA